MAESLVKLRGGGKHTGCPLTSRSKSLNTRSIRASAHSGFSGLTISRLTLIQT